MTQSLVNFTRERCPELADFLVNACATPLTFEEGAHPNTHSADNHIHLFELERWADHHSWIDLDYRTQFAELIFARWRGRLKGLWPYRASGYRFYLYEDLAPTVSAVAETAEGFPYPGEPTFVSSPRDIMARFAERSWAGVFDFEPWAVSREKLIAAVEANAGSISKPTAASLGLKVGQLRTTIEVMGLDGEVNRLRKRFKRRPAKFRTEADLPFRYHCYELRLPAGYR